MSSIKMENTVETATKNAVETVGTEKSQSAFSKKLDSYFHFTEKGSTLGNEVKAGLVVFFISVCALFMNIQIVIQAFSSDIPYSGLYLGATITAFVGTLLAGLICRIPLVQTASLSISTVMISMLGAGSGLTYSNLLAVTLVAAVVYLITASIPRLRDFIYHMIPDSVRCALPAAMGLYIAYVALSNMGLVDGLSLGGLSDDVLGGAAYAPYMRLCIIAGIIGFVLVAMKKKRKSDNPLFSGFLWATLIFFLIASVAGGIAFTYVFSTNRIWVGVNPDPLGEMYTIGLGIKELQFAVVFKEGFDFSAFTASGGNVAILFIRAIIMFLFLGMYESEASVLGAQASGEIIEDGKYEEAAGRFLFVNAITNVIAPIFGAAPVSIAKQSSVAAADGGKTGLTSVVCAIGYLVSMFTWIPFVIFATYTKSVPEYGHAGFVIPNVIYASFQIADAVMLVMGLLMLRSILNMKDHEVQTVIPYGTTIVMAVFTQNIAYGAAAGTLAAVILTLASFWKKEIKLAGAAQYVMSVLAILLLLLSMTYSSAKSTGGENPGANDSSVTTGTTDINSTGSNADTSDAENTAGFTFDSSTGAFAFTGDDTAEYYTVWVYAVNDAGEEEGEYVAASSRLSGRGEITGEVDVSALAFGTYHANLNTFAASGSNPHPISVEFTLGGKLSVPEFKYVQDGTNVTITLFSDTLTTYNERELFADIDINIYDANGEVVQTETITDADLVESLMGPMTSYSCEKTISVKTGEYQLSLTAKGDGNLAEVSDESEKIDLVVKDGASSEGMTSGYSEQEEGMGGPM